jgi:selenocysteine lyase/cysteine desulfurase
MIPETGQLDWEHLQKCLTTKTRVLAIGAASNALGTVNDIRRAAALGHQVGARVFVDAVHYAPHFLPDVKEIDCDFLACSAYKFYGPHVGILYGKHDLLEELDVPRLVPAPDKHAERLETGTQNHEGIAGAAAAVNFLAGLHPEPSLDRRLRLVLVYDELEKRGAEQFGNLWNGLRTIEGVTLYGPSPEVTRTSTLSFTVNGKDSSDVSRRLADLGLFTSHGDFYATTVVEQLGLASQGLVRVGCACYTSEPEIEQLIGGVRSIV